MTLTRSPGASPVPVGSAVDALSPLRLPPGLRLTPEQFELVCAENREAVLELAADGLLITTRPTGSETGARNSELVFQLQRYARSDVSKATGGWKVFDSSSGFRLPDGAVFSPDASLLRLERWQALSAEERRGFAPLCPDLVVKLASPSDEGPRGLTALRRKMESYQSNGARLGWLLIPHQQAVEVWPPDGASQRFEGLAVLEAGPDFPGLQLDLKELWAG